MAPILCEFCEPLSSIERLFKTIRQQPMYNIYNIYRHPYPHQPSVGALNQSAQNGCGFCQFIMDCLDASRSSEGKPPAPADSPVSICLEILGVTEERKSIEDTCYIKRLFIQLGSPFHKAYCTFELNTPSGMNLSLGFLTLTTLATLTMLPNAGRILTIQDTTDNMTVRVGRPELDLNIGSASAFGTARKWLHACRQDHSGCLCDSLPKLPTRVIDVGTFQSTLAPRLVVTNGQTGEYVALSHCWGGNIATLLVADTLSTFQQSLPYADLAQNFRDAIAITRELGVRYLWIDSLCIIQDSKEDWAAESARMGSIYRNSVITVSAMASANSGAGILSQYTSAPRLTRTMRVYEAEDQLAEATIKLIHPPHDRMETMRDLWENSPLTARGWTLQELLLSPRHLFYGRRQIYWKCPDGFRSAAEGALYDDELPIYPKEMSSALHRERLSIMPSEPQDRRRLLLNYYSLLREYSMRKFTNLSDTLPAFAGIASGLQPTLGGDYVAGLWTCDLVHGLLWRRGHMERGEKAFTTPSTARNDPSAPTWSWAAAHATIEHNHPDLPTTPWQVRYLSHESIPVNSVNPFGQVKSARLTVEGLVIPLIPKSSDVRSSRLFKAAEVELSPQNQEKKVQLFHPLLTAKSSVPSSATIPASRKAQPLDGDDVWRIIDSHWHRGAALPAETEKILGHQVLIDSPDFRDDGLCVLLVHANTMGNLYWADGYTVGLMLRPRSSEAGNVYERIGYVQIHRVRIRWLQSLEIRVIILV